MIHAGLLTPPRRISLRTALGWLAFGLVVVLLFGAVAVGNGLYFFVIAALVGLTIAAWRHPVITACFFAAFVPVNRIVILLIFHFTGSGALTKLTELWKDGLLVLLFARILYDTAFSRRQPRVKYLDLLVLFFIGFSAIYLFYSVDDLMTRLQGFRSDAFFLLAYFIGRGIRLQRRHVAWLIKALLPGSVAVALVAAMQFVMPGFSNALLYALGFKEFSVWQGITGDIEPVRDRILQGGNIPRASSLLLSDLALAYYALMLVAIGAALFFEAKSERRRFWTGLFLLAMIATLTLTITRSAILTAIPVLLISALLARSLGKLFLITGVCLALGVSGLLVSRIPLTAIGSLFSPTEASTVGHENALLQSIRIIEEDPLGRGLGTAGSIGQRYYAQAVTNESWYLQLATEMGMVSAVTYLAMTAGVVVIAVAAYRRLRDYHLRVLALGMAGTALGFLIMSNFLHAWEDTAQSMLVWLFAGIVVRAPDLERAGP